MTRADKEKKRAARKAREGDRSRNKLAVVRKKLARLQEVMRLANECPDLDQFIASQDISQMTKLIGIFVCSPDEYLKTEAVLEKHGHLGYRTLKCEIEGERGSDGDGKGRGWTSVVKREGEPDEAFKTVIGIVRRPLKGDSTSDSTSDETARWMEVISVVHELGHAYDMDNGITFHLGQPFNIEEAEIVAHNFVCQSLRKQKQLWGLVVYLSTVICAMKEYKDESAGVAARRFQSSDEYRLSLKEIPRHIRKQFSIEEAL